ncbi:MAG: LytTR family DNA-binding domain-containing protein [Ruminococcus sp.]|nr:LytTR family DNA-binding domain-containing protein [Ruminococcus sp.]
MNIAICDDEPVFLKQLHNRIRSMKIPDCEVHEFTSGRDLLSFYVKGMYEVIILDVEMPELNGLETAERIRQIDKSVIISFLTNYSEFAVQGYDVGAFRYILKNQPDYMYTKQLNSIIDECKQRFRTFTFNNKNLSFKFKLTDILYFEGHRRKLTLFTLNGELEYSGELSIVCGELLKYNFIMINRGILVNLDHIQNITKYDVVLSNGRKIPIGRIYKDEVVSRYLDYATGR